MKNLKNLIKTALVAGAIGLAGNFYAPNKSFSQIPKSDLNFYFETEGYPNYDNSGSKKHALAWLSSKPKDDKTGNIWFYYGDTNDDEVYDYVSIQNYGSPIRSQEKFYFNFDTKKINYVLEIYDYCPDYLTLCDKIVSKSYNEISQKEAEQIGEGFFERITEFAKTQKEFSRFNSGELEELVRKEYSSRLKMNNGKLVGNSRIPIEKFLSEEEIKKVENYSAGKPERERIKREQEEKYKMECEKEAKFRREQERERKKGKKIRAVVMTTIGVFSTMLLIGALSE